MRNTLLTEIHQVIRGLQAKHSEASGDILRCTVCPLVVHISEAILLQHCYNFLYTLSVTVQGVLIHPIFQKTANLSIFSRSRYDSGHIQNLMATDCRTVSHFARSINELYGSVILTIMSMVPLVKLLEWIPSLFSSFPILICIPIQMRLSHYITKIEKTASKKTDERIKTVSELINGMKLIKLYGWEIPFIRQTQSIRAEKLHLFGNIHFLGTCNFVLMSNLSCSLSALAFAPGIIFGDFLDVASICCETSLFSSHCTVSVGAILDVLNSLSHRYALTLIEV